MLNWTQLVTQGRAKDIGIAWSEEEQEALKVIMAHSGVERVEAARYVRQGITTAKAFDKATKATKPATRPELEKQAKEAGVDFDATVTPDTVLEKQIATAKKKK